VCWHAEIVQVVPLRTAWLMSQLADAAPTGTFPKQSHYRWETLRIPIATALLVSRVAVLAAMSWQRSRQAAHRQP